jgi:hypothetical protein
MENTQNKTKSMMGFVLLVLIIIPLFSIQSCREKGLVKNETPEQTILSFSLLLQRLDFEHSEQADVFKKVLIDPALTDYLDSIGTVWMGGTVERPPIIQIDVSGQEQEKENQALNEDIKRFIEYANQIRCHIVHIDVEEMEATAWVYFFDTQNLVRLERKLVLVKQKDRWYIKEIRSERIPLEIINQYFKERDNTMMELIPTEEPSVTDPKQDTIESNEDESATEDQTEQHESSPLENHNQPDSSDSSSEVPASE